MKNSADQISRRQFCIASGAVVAAGAIPTIANADSAGGVYQHQASVHRLAGTFRSSLTPDEATQAQAHAARLAPWSNAGRMPNSSEQDRLVHCMQKDFYNRNHVVVGGIRHSQVEVGVILNMDQSTHK